jgi:HEAT repeat protein
LSLQEALDELSSPKLLERIKADCALIAAGQNAVEPLLAVLNNLSNPIEARWRATANLGDIGDPRAVESLITAIADDIWDVRASAIWALGMIGDGGAFESLQAIVENPIPDEQNSYVAARALLTIDRSRAVDVLQNAAEHSNHRVRSWGRSALASLKFQV